jgi:hypothetical protein
MSAQQWERDGHSVIRLGDETAVVVPLAEYRRVKALEEIATAEEIDEAEDAAVMAEYREWEAAGRPGALTHEQAMAQLLIDS